MKEIYIIEIDESDAYDENVGIYDKCFSTYELAKEHLLENFECQSSNDGKEYFILKENYNYTTEFYDGATAIIEKLNLIK